MCSYREFADGGGAAALPCEALLREYQRCTAAVTGRLPFGRDELRRVGMPQTLLKEEGA